MSEVSKWSQKGEYCSKTPTETEDVGVAEVEADLDVVDVVDTEQVWFLKRMVESRTELLLLATNSCFRWVLLRK